MPIVGGVLNLNENDGGCQEDSWFSTKPTNNKEMSQIYHGLGRQQSICLVRRAGVLNSQYTLLCMFVCLCAALTEDNGQLN